MLPSNPRPRAPGTRPGVSPQSISRSRTTSRPTRDYHIDHDNSRQISRPITPSHQIRSQRSAANLPSYRESASRRDHLPPLPRSPQRRDSSSNEKGLYIGTFPSSHSTSDVSSPPSSSSSASSSLFDRMHRRPGGSATSLTSLENEEHRKLASSRWPPSKEDLATGQEDNIDDTYSTQGVAAYSYAVWNRIASAASALTVNVDVSWATNIVNYSGEVTPPGKDSRLTCAMKAYHLGKAREPSDLPSWLFTEQERRAVRGAMFATDEKESDGILPVEEVPIISRRTGLRDIYDNVAHNMDPVAPRPSMRRKNDEPAPPSKVTNRLKALREAKRSAVAGGNSIDADEQNDYHERRPMNSDSFDQISIKRSQTQRVGLPSRPGTTRRV